MGHQEVLTRQPDCITQIGSLPSSSSSPKLRSWFWDSRNCDIRSTLCSPSERKKTLALSQVGKNFHRSCCEKKKKKKKPQVTLARTESPVTNRRHSPPRSISPQTKPVPNTICCCALWEGAAGMGESTQGTPSIRLKDTGQITQVLWNRRESLQLRIKIYRGLPPILFSLLPFQLKMSTQGDGVLGRGGCCTEN